SRAAANATRRRMNAHKRVFADRLANAIYELWLEEAIHDGTIEAVKPLLAKNPNFFYEGLNKEAICKAGWIGASAGQGDELKETQAAVLRSANNHSTEEIEAAKLGYDYRDVLKQRARERRQREALGLPEPAGNATKPGTLSSQRGAAQTDEEDDAQARAYAAGEIDQDGLDADGNRPYDDDDGLD